MPTLTMSKRQKFIVTSILLSLGFVAINLLDNQYRFFAIGGLSLATAILFFWSLSEGLGKNATLLTLILPTFFTLGVGLFWFLLPTTIFARIPVVALYAVCLYALCLTLNIYTVSAIRTIALVRAARGVGFVLTLLTFFLIFDAILSLKQPIWITTALGLVASFPLFLQGLWVSKLGPEITRDLLTYSAVFAVSLTQIVAVLYFWPVTVVVGSLFLTIGSYLLLGLGQASLEERLFKTTFREYITIGLVVFIAMFLATRWGE